MVNERTLLDEHVIVETVVVVLQRHVVELDEYGRPLGGDQCPRAVEVVGVGRGEPGGGELLEGGREGEVTATT